VNREHLRAFLWLRWRLRKNQFRKAGAINLAFFAIVVAMTAIGAVGLFIAGFFVGWLALPHAPPIIRLVVWDGTVVALLFFWMIGLLTELQRTESLAIDKFLHLPVSVSGVFLINYLSSLGSLSLVMIVPGMVGLVLGETIAHGVQMLLALLVVAAFVFALTAITYQFQGWLASLMANQRRRRTVIVLVTLGFILVFQIPNLINIVRPWDETLKPMERHNQRQQELQRAMNAQEITPEEYQKLQADDSQQWQQEQQEATERLGEKFKRTTRIVNVAVPFGWLPLGAAGLTDGEVVPALLAILGFGLIGSASLWRAYRTTLRLYTGQFSSGEHKAPTPKSEPTSTKPRLVEWRLPWVSEQASAVAAAGMRSLMRAPEAKMALLAPIIMVVVFGGIFASTNETLPRAVRPFVALAGAAVTLLSAVQLIGNQFGYDRTGFRAFILAPIPRREILIGKNLAVAPLAIGLGMLIVIIFGSVFPMRVDYYPAAIIQLTSAFILFCLMANTLSILAPMPMAAGSMKASDIKLIPVLLQFVFLMLMPIVFLPAVVPIVVELVLSELNVVSGWPISLALSLLLFVAVVFIYRKMVTVEGDWLSLREKKILEVVTSKSE
jgi:ABC-2 type transport system permease protein